MLICCSPYAYIKSCFTVHYTYGTCMLQTSRLDLSDAEIHQLQTDLKSAQKRAESLKNALEQSAMSDDE